MANTSVLTDYIILLARYRIIVELSTSDNIENDFVEFQKLLPRIINAYQKGYYNHENYKALCTMYYDIYHSFQLAVKYA